MNKKQIQQIINAYDLGKLVSYKPTVYGLANDNCIVKTDRGKYIFRCFNEHRRVEEVLYEIDLLNYLVKKKFPYKVPLPLKTQNGSSILADKYLVYAFIQGVNKTQFSTAQVKELAKMVAVYHKTILAFKSKYKKDWGNAFATIWQRRDLADWGSKATGKTIRGRLLLKNVDYFNNLLDYIDAKYRNVKLPRYSIHNDLNHGNFIFRKDKLIGLIDFDNCNLDYLVKDIAQFLYRGAGRRAVMDFKVAKLFLDEYRKIRPLSKKEISYIPDIAIVSEIGAFIWLYGCIERSNKKIRLTHLKETERQVHWFDENRDKIIEALT
jgi:homoserine kinase type II